MGVPGCTIPAQYGGMGLDDAWLVLLLEEAGRAALPEPLAATTVAAALLAEVGGEELRAEWLPRVASGEALLTIRTPACSYVPDAVSADLILVAHGDDVHGLIPAAAMLTPQPTIDRSRRLFAIGGASSGWCIARGAGRAVAAASDRAVLAEAAFVLGAAQKLIDMAAAYAIQRQQFGVPIGSFQAVKHLLADALVQVEFARPLVYRAAWSVATAQPTRGTDVRQAYRAMTAAGRVAGRASLQVHGAIGYTYEHDLHLWLHRALVPA